MFFVFFWNLIYIWIIPKNYSTGKRLGECEISICRYNYLFRRSIYNSLQNIRELFLLWWYGKTMVFKKMDRNINSCCCMDFVILPACIIKSFT